MCGGDAGEMLWVGKGVTVFLLDLGVGVRPATAGCHVVWCTLAKVESELVIFSNF